MLGETDANWHDCIRRTLEMQPDSVTIYQMELPFNTTISGDRLKGTGRFTESLANWSTKRRWVAEAFEALESAGYQARSAYTLVRNPAETRFVYTDRLWEGADLVGLGVASFGHVNGVHMQNLDQWEAYAAAIDRGQVPLARAYRPTADERLIREFVLQFKRGVLYPAYFRRRYGVDVADRFAEPLAAMRAEGLVTITPDSLKLSREALFRVDVLLRRFFRPEHMDVRYT
jgi:oxygen-independent coproporphyrinogen-3 oxidase